MKHGCRLDRKKRILYCGRHLEIKWHKFQLWSWPANGKERYTLYFASLTTTQSMDWRNVAQNIKYVTHHKKWRTHTLEIDLLRIKTHTKYFDMCRKNYFFQRRSVYQKTDNQFLTVIYLDWLDEPHKKSNFNRVVQVDTNEVIASINLDLRLVEITEGKYFTRRK